MLSLRSFFILVAIVALVIPVSISQASLVEYTGSLSSENGLDGTGSWATDVSLSWTVTELANGNWSYEYELTMLQKDISHFLIEVSPSFTGDNIIDGVNGGSRCL